MYDIPKIRLDIDGMRYSVVHAFAQHNREIEEYLDAEVKRFIESYDYRAAVAKVMSSVLEQTITDTLRRHFEFGPGRKAIEDAVQSSLEK